MMIILNLSSIKLSYRKHSSCNGILEDATIAVSLKYPSKFWKSHEIPLINCKVEYIKKNNRLISVDLCRTKELNADPKAIHQREFVGQLKKLDDNGNATDAGNYQSMFFNNFRKGKSNKKQNQNFLKEL